MTDGLVINDGILEMCTGACADVRIPDGTRELAPGAFILCVEVGRVFIPGSVKEIGVRAFSSCSSLRQVFIEEGTELVCPLAFEDCGALETVHLPESLLWICRNSFYGCPDALTIVTPSGAYTKAEYIAQLEAAGTGRRPREGALSAWERFGAMRRDARERELNRGFDIRYYDGLHRRDVLLYMDGREFEFRHDITDRSRDLWDPLPPDGIFDCAEYLWEHDQYGACLSVWRKRDVLYLELDNHRASAYVRYDDYLRAVTAAGGRSR